MTTLNIIISIINSIIDIYLINLFIKTIYHIKDKEHHNKLIIFLEFILLVLSNYLKFKYLWIKIILLFLAVYLKNKKYMYRIDKLLLSILTFVIIKYPFEQILSYFFEYIFNTRMLNTQMYFSPLKIILLEIIIKYCEYTVLTLFVIYYTNHRNHKIYFILVSIII